MQVSNFLHVVREALKLKVCFVMLLTVASVTSSRGAEVEEKRISMPFAENTSETLLAAIYVSGGYPGPGAPPEYGKTRFIFGLWEDGTVAWSANLVKGGEPYRKTQIAPEEIEAFTENLQEQSFMESEDFRRGEPAYLHFARTFMVIQRPNGYLRTSVVHEITESYGGVVSARGPERLQNETLEEALARGPESVRNVRNSWIEAKEFLLQLVPDEEEWEEMPATSISWRGEYVNLIK